MNIKKKDDNLVLFEDLVGGDAFKFFGTYYLKINSNYFNNTYGNCISIVDGVLTCLAKNDLVEPIKGSFMEE